jgi:hypothetical protein
MVRQQSVSKTSNPIGTSRRALTLVLNHLTILQSGPQGSDNTTSSSEDSIRSSARVLPLDQVAAVRPATWEDLRTRLWTMPGIRPCQLSRMRIAVLALPP